jgi:SNF2 family DNA or RNA helicase
MVHQSEAVEKMLPTRIGALFMEMGTGKSRTAIEIIHRRLSRIKKVFWFCPVSLKQTIRHEILKHTDCTDADVHVFGDKTNERTAPVCLWYVVGIESMSASARVVVTVNKLITEDSLVIVDESSYIKGHNATRTQRITKLSERARYRLILTGTPISQGVVDLYAQMRFLSPKILGYRSFYSFAANHLEYSEKFPGMIVRSHNLEFIAAKIKPYVYQVTKDECLDLPDKLYETRYFSMTGDQRQAYEQAKEEIIPEIENDTFDSVTIFRLFIALQQIVCGFWNQHRKGRPVDRHEFDHRRTDVLMDTVTSIPENEQIIIWTKYKHDIEEISAALQEKFGGDCVAPFHGALNEKRRSAQVERFRDGSRFFLATQSCGGHGLTLNESHYVIYYNNAFKYSERQQSEDRCHRIGQEHKVVYIDIQCSDSIDDRIAKALASKGSVVEQFKAEVDKVKCQKGKLKDMVKAL